MPEIKGDDDVEMYMLDEVKHEESSDPLLQKKNVGFTGLSKQELMEIEKNETYWRKLRISLFILFWVVWFGMLAAAIVIIIVTPKCPYQPTLRPWEKTCIYRLNPFAFKDSDNDNVGDLKGLEEKMDYVKELKVETIIMDPVVKGSFGDGDDYLYLTTDFKDIQPRFGNLSDLKTFILKSRKDGMTIIATLDLNGVGAKHSWAATSNLFITEESLVSNSFCKLNGVKHFTSMQPPDTLPDPENNCLYLDLNISNAEVVSKMQEVVKFWLSDMGVGGIVFTNGAFLVKEGGDVNDAIKYLTAIREVFDKVNAAASKKKVFMLEAGDVTTETAARANLTQFLNPETLVDVVLTELPRSWKDTFERLKSSDWGFSQAVESATPFERRANDLQTLVGTYLLPNLTVIYMGTELDMYSSLHSHNNTLYPKKAQTVRAKKSNAPVSPAMMSWTMDGVSDNSVEMFSSEGAPQNTLTLVKSLVALKKLPSFHWGSASLVKEAVNATTNATTQLIFTREATGYPKFVVVYTNMTHRSVVSLSKECPGKGAVHVAFPESAVLSKGTKISLHSVYVPAQEQLIVVECLVSS